MRTGLSQHWSSLLVNIVMNKRLVPKIKKKFERKRNWRILFVKVLIGVGTGRVVVGVSIRRRNRPFSVRWYGKDWRGVTPFVDKPNLGCRREPIKQKVRQTE